MFESIETYLFLRSQGFSGSLPDMLYQYLETQGFTNKSLPEMIYLWLGSLGYTGTINDRIYQFNEAGGWSSLGGSGTWILATGFWDDSGSWDDTDVWID